MKTELEYPEEDDAIRRMQDVLLRVLEARFGTGLEPVLSEVEARVHEMRDREALEALLARAVTAPTLADMGLE